MMYSLVGISGADAGIIGIDGSRDVTLKKNLEGCDVYRMQGETTHGRYSVRDYLITRLCPC
jgi:hypothetical protein